jgi:TRAP-type C4-dicarboxylate transport system substrate-binding protein
MMIKIRKYMLIPIAILVCLSAVIGCGETDKTRSTTPAPNQDKDNPIELSVCSVGPILGFAKIFWEDFFKTELEKASDGKVKVNIFPASVTEKTEWDAILAGRYDIAYGSFSSYSGMFSASEVMGLPFLFPSGSTNQFGKPVHYVWPVWKDLFQKYPEIRSEFKDVKLLCVLMGGGGNIWTQKPITRLADINGLKIRAGIVMDAKALKILGATPVTLTASEIYTSIERKVIDGSCASWGGGVAIKTHELCKYALDLNLDHGTGFWVAMSPKTWNELPSEIRDIINNMFDPDNIISRVGSDIFFQDEAKGRQTALDSGVKIVSVSQEDLQRGRNLAAPLWESWVDSVEARGIPGKQILADALELVEKYSK